MSIVENSRYEHEEHGVVHVIKVGDEQVAFELMGENDSPDSGMDFPKFGYEEVDAFEENVSPADVSVDADYIRIMSKSVTPQ